jgi:hypothetical protein
MKEPVIPGMNIIRLNGSEIVSIVIDTSTISVSIPRMSVRHARCADLEELNDVVRRIEGVIRALMLSAEGMLLPHDDIRCTGTIGLCVW